MNKRDLMKLLAEEVLEKSDDKEIKCIPSYMMGFSSGLQKMNMYIMMTVLSEAKKQNIEVPEELKSFCESLQSP